MTSFLKNVASYGGMGGLPGMYAADKGFRSKANDFLFGTSDQTDQLSNYTPQQQQFFDNFLQQLMGMQGAGGGVSNATNILNQYLDPQSDIYKNFEAPYRQEYEQQTLPMLAERFAGAGAQGGALSSSGFGQALGAAGANLQTNLAQMKSNMQRQSIGDILGLYQNMSGQALNARPFDYQFKPGSQGMVPSALAAFAGGLGRSFGGGF